ncbi:MAG TPA: FkbM family methyltransferase [Azospirillum sp.]|nr:FkbM family methyltransferase [Azospirillum sp.]
MEHSVAELERALVGALDTLARTGGDWRALEAPAPGAVDLSTAPLVLIGAGSVIAQPFVAHALARLNVAGIVDNARAGTVQHGHTILDDAGLRALMAREPALVGVMCCCADRAVEHFSAIWAPGGRPLLSLFQAMRHAGLDTPDAFSDPAAVAALLDRRDVWEGYADEESRRTYLALLLHRLTWDRAWIEPRRLPYKAMYFFTDALDVGEDETLVDGGAFDGDTVVCFNERTAGRYRAIHAFEVDPANVEALRRRTAGLPRVTVHLLGLWDGEATLHLSPGGAASSVGDGGGVEVPVRALDSLDLGPVSLIKLDIEGAEIPALRGAAETIRRHKPKLSLAVYHKPDDLVAIQDAITAIRPDYRFRLRHHSPIFHDTVLYAE